MPDGPPVPYALIAEFQRTYDADEKDRQWQALSAQFRNFWDNRVLSHDPSEIADTDCDPIIRILDRNGKGNTKDSESVAKAMIPQGAWRRMFNEFHSNHELADRLTAVFKSPDSHARAENIDALYRLNEGQRNNLTGPSCNAVGTFLAAFLSYDSIREIAELKHLPRMSERIIDDFEQSAE